MGQTSRTIESLRGAITGEFNAAKKYLKFAAIAAAEKFPNVACLFRALAMAEGIHLKNHRQALGETNYQPEEKEVKSGPTQANVQTGAETELWEYKTMYPGFMKTVKKESKMEIAKLALVTMDWARNVEKVHAAILTKALQNLQSGKDADITEIWICTVCGNLIINIKPKVFCEICKHDVMFFELVER